MKFRMTIFVGAALVCFSKSTIAQDSVNSVPTRPLAVFAEVGGGSWGLTFNVEKTLLSFSERLHINLRAGGATYPTHAGRTRLVSIPVGLSTHYGKKDHIELGFTMTYLKGSGFSEHPVRDQTSESLMFTPSLGYRFQKPEKSFFLKVQYTPSIKLKELSGHSLFETNLHEVVHLAGICVGYSFPIPRQKLSQIK